MEGKITIDLEYQAENLRVNALRNDKSITCNDSNEILNVFTICQLLF